MAVRAAEVVREGISAVVLEWESRVKGVRCVQGNSYVYIVVNSTCQGTARSGEGGVEAQWLVCSGDKSE